MKLYAAFIRYTAMLFVGLALTPTFVKANPYGHWQYIRTEHYDIFFLPPLLHEAQRMANTLEGLYGPINKSLQTTPRRTTVVFKSQFSQANSLARLNNRVYFYSFPTQNYNHLYNNDWLHHVALHELRHIGQYSTLLQHYSLLKPTWTASDLFILKWLLEGDAVGLETALSAGGRGRIPAFLLLYKVNLLERGGFSYYKNLYGSFQHKVCNQYQLGYVMTTYLRRTYGADIIRQILARKGFSDAINPLSIEQKIKKYTGKTVVQIYEDANAMLKTCWTNQLKNLSLTPFQTLNSRPSEDYTDYSHPHPTNDGVVLLKSGIAIIPYFVHLDAHGQEEPIVNTINTEQEIRFSMARNTLYWVETCPALRWSDIVYTAIQSYNLKNKTYKTLVSAGRYNVVAASPDASRLAAVETDTAYHHRIVILNAKKGHVLYALPNPNNHYYLTPSWSPDGQQLVAIKQTNNKSTITLIDAHTGQEEDLFPLTQELIGSPVLKPPYVYYSSAYSGIDNLYAIDIVTKQRFQVTSSKYGAYNPAVTDDGQWLLYNDFGKDGLEAVKIRLNPTTWIPLEKVEDRSIHYYDMLVDQEANPTVLEQLPKQTYPVHAYNPWKKLGLGVDNFALTLKDFFNTAKWKIIDLHYSEITFGNLQRSIDNINMRKFPPIHINPVVATNITYKGWYPIISLKAKFSEFGSQQPIQNVNTLRLKVPFTWIARGYIYKTVLETQTLFLTKLEPYNTWTARQQYGINFGRYSPKSHRDLNHPWGQCLEVAYLHSLFGELPPLYGALPQHKILPKVTFLFPGLFNNHSLSLSYAHEYEFVTFLKENRILKGFGNQQKLNVNYFLPLFYPEVGVGKFIFFKRIWLMLWYQLEHDFSAIQKHMAGTTVMLNLQWLQVGLNMGYTSKGQPILSTVF